MKAPAPAAVRDWAIAGAVGFAAWTLYRFFNPADADPNDGEGGHVDPAAADPRPATFTNAEAVGIANGIKAALYGGLGEDEAAVVDLLLRAQVTDDVRLLVNAYGYFGPPLSPTYSLSAAVRAYLSQDDIDIVNVRYIARDIQFRF